MAPTLNEHGPTATGRGELGLVLTGGGARAAYQVGLLVWLAKRYPDLRIPILTGVSAGGVNIAHLASHHGTFVGAVGELVHLWSALTTEHVFRADPGTLGWTVARWALRLMSGGRIRGKAVRAMVDTTPLREFLEEVYHAVGGELTGIDYNVRQGRVRAVALSTTCYSTGQSVTWVQGRDIELWSRPQRRSVLTTLTVEHVMASAALPLFFPAVRIGSEWYGDGGVRLAAPLSPALALGARRVLAVSTRYARSEQEAAVPTTVGYPPPAQVMGLLFNAIFLDLIDQDAVRLQRLNRLVEELPPEQRQGLSVIELLVLRPSRDLARMSRDFEPQLPKAFRFLTRGLGTREQASPDLLSMVMFQPDYLQAMIELGERDAQARSDELAMLIEG